MAARRIPICPRSTTRLQRVSLGFRLKLLSLLREYHFHSILPIPLPLGKCTDHSFSFTPFSRHIQSRQTHDYERLRYRDAGQRTVLRALQLHHRTLQRDRPAAVQEAAGGARGELRRDERAAGRCVHAVGDHRGAERRRRCGAVPVGRGQLDASGRLDRFPQQRS